MMTRRNLVVLVAGLVVAGAGRGIAVEVQGAEPNSLKTKIVLLENKATHVKFKLVGDARLGPFTAHVESDPITVQKSQSKVVTTQVAGINFRITAKCTATSLEVRTEAWVYVQG